MRDNYFIKLIKYINNAYQIDKKIDYVTDKRVNPTYKISQITLIILIGFLLRTSSINVPNSYLKTGEFDWMKNRIHKIDAIRNSFKSINLDGLRKINTSGTPCLHLF